MSINKEQKKKILADLQQKFDDAKSVVFVSNNGLSVGEISELRNQLRAKGAEYKIAKKTLIKLAAKNTGVDDVPDELVEGSIGATFTYDDAVSGASILYKFAKETKKIELKGGILDGELIDQVRVKYLATLPSKEQLLANLMGSMQAPLNGFYSVLSNGVLGGFVRTLNAYREKQESA